MKLSKTDAKTVGRAFSESGEGKLFVIRFGRVAIIWDFKQWSAK